MTYSETWGEDAARHYDDPTDRMFTAAVLEPTIAFLGETAAGGPALEFAIGTGRVGVPLRESGTPVTGIELSEPMLAVLRTKADGQQIPVVVGDMATATAPGAGDFTLVYLVYNTISNLQTQDAQVECFRNAARHLAPGGRFVIELEVPPLRLLPPTAVAAPFEVSENHLGFDTFDLVKQHVVSHHYKREGATFRYSSGTYRYAWPAELDLMAKMAGLHWEARYADWDRTPFTDESTSHVSVWRKEG